jgi:thiol-disulfide isomerase/thioredoxin
MPGAKATNATVKSFIDRKLSFEVQSVLTMKVAVPGAPSMEMTEKMVKKAIKVDVPIPPSVFEFSPPEGARLVERLTIPSSFGGVAEAANAELVGKDAPPFEVKGLDGQTYRLSDFKGKPLLLDFWATWCAPCRDSVPVVESLYDEYRDQGLSVLAVSSEDPEVVKTFLQGAPFPYPAVIGDEAGIEGSYLITLYPTFVMIGPDGRIAGYQGGFPGARGLRRLLESGGLKPAAKR